MRKIAAVNSGTLLMFLLLQLLLTAVAVQAFQGPGAEGCGAGECKDCHNLEAKEVASLLKIKENEILSLAFSEVPGLWMVEVVKQGKTFSLYIDFSKEFVVQGQVFRVKPPTEGQGGPQPPKVIDPARIPLHDALLIGKSDAARKIIVFDDPECKFCAVLQTEMHAVVEAHPNIAFLIKMFPLTKIHPDAYEKARAIVCSKSLAMLEDSLAGRPVPPPLCETDQVKQNLELGRELGIFSTPTMIMPDGRLIAGSQKAEDIVKLLNGEVLKPKAGK